MLDEQKYTKEEEAYYGELVETKAEEIHRASTHEQMEKIIEGVLKSDEIHKDLLLRFRRDVQTRVNELRKSQKDEREKYLLDEFEGKVQEVDGKYLPAGVDKNFRVRVKPPVSKFWRVGELYDRVFGMSVDAKKFHAIIEDVQKLDEEIDRLQRDAELLRAAQKSTKELLAIAGSGFMARFRSRGAGGIGEAAGASVREFFETRKEQKREKREIKAAEKLIKEKMKELERKKEIRERTLQKVAELREEGRRVFEKTFEKQIQVLLEQKESGRMKEAEYKRKVAALRRKVLQYGVRTGFVHMETFLDEALGITPASVRAEEEKTPLEKKKEHAVVARWIIDNAGWHAESKDVDGFVDVIGQQMPEILDAIVNKKAADITKLVTFFFKGEYGKTKLDPNLCEDQYIDLLIHHLGNIRYYLKHKDNLEEIIKAFSEKKLKAREFDAFFREYIAVKPEEAVVRKDVEAEELKKQQEQAEKDRAEKIKEEAELKKDFAMAKNMWKECAMHEPSDDDVSDLLKRVREKYKDNRPKYRKLLSDKNLPKIISFFFSGKYGDEEFIRNPDRLLEETGENMFNAFGVAIGIADLTAEDIQYAFRHLSTQWENLKEVTSAEIVKIIEEKKSEKKEQIEKRDNVALAKIMWKEATMAEIGDDKARAFLGRLRSIYPEKYEKILSNMVLPKIMRFFFTGEYDGKQLLSNLERMLDDTVDNVMEVLQRALQLADFRRDEVSYVFNNFSAQKGRKLQELSVDVAREILTKKESEKEKEIQRKRLIQYLRETLQLGPDSHVAVELFESAFATDVDLQKMLEKNENRKKMRFFISGNFVLNQSHTLNLKNIVYVRKDKESLANLLEILPILDQIDEKTFYNQAVDFFGHGGPVKKRGRTMSDFLKHISNFTKTKS